MFVRFLELSITVVVPIFRFGVPEPDAPLKLIFVPEISTVFADVPIYSAPVPIPPNNPIFVLLCAESRSIASDVLAKNVFSKKVTSLTLLMVIGLALPVSFLIVKVSLSVPTLKFLATPCESLRSNLGYVPVAVMFPLLVISPTTSIP